jgi:hypothetical protein
MESMSFEGAKMAVEILAQCAEILDWSLLVELTKNVQIFSVRP